MLKCTLPTCIDDILTHDSGSARYIPSCLTTKALLVRQKRGSYLKDIQCRENVGKFAFRIAARLIIQYAIRFTDSFLA